MVNYLRATNTKILPHPLYSPDLSPSDFFLFARLKHNMRGLTFNTLDELKAHVDFQIGKISQWEYVHAMHDSWNKRLQLCINHQGRYFET